MKNKIISYALWVGLHIGHEEVFSILDTYAACFFFKSLYEYVVYI